MTTEELRQYEENVHMLYALMDEVLYCINYVLDLYRSYI